MIKIGDFPNKKPDETVEFFLRRHWFAILKVVVLFIVLAILPIVIYFIFYDVSPQWLNHSIITPILAVFASIYYLFIWMFAFQEYVDFYLDTWIITNERVISNEQFGLFKRVTSELHLENIQDVTSEVSGIIHTMFDYGDLYIQTAGETQRFELKNIEEPEKIKHEILRLVEEDQKRHAGEMKQLHREMQQ